MTFFSTFIIIYEDKDLQEATDFLPAYWQKEDIDIEGDYYYTNTNSRWNSLELRISNNKEPSCGFTLNIYRKEAAHKKRPEIEALKEYVDQFEENCFAHDELKEIKSPAVAKMTFVSTSLDEYREFLQTVYEFLKHTSGFAIHVLDREYDAEEFYACFINV